MAYLSLKGINKIYPNGFHAVHDFNLEIERGEFIVFVGPSGCGKSTTLRMIAGLENISNGEFCIDGKRANEIGPREREIAMVFQSYALYPHMSVYDNMAFGLSLQGVDDDVIDRKVQETARILGLTDYLDRKPRALSGGQRQRVAVGRAIIRKVGIFLMDEPLSNLDAKQRVTMRSEITDIHRKVGATTIYVTHDQTEAMTMADRIVCMKDGYIQQVGTPTEVFDMPDNLFVAEFIGAPKMNTFKTDLVREGEKYYVTPYGAKMEVTGKKADMLKAKGIGNCLYLVQGHSAFFYQMEDDIGVHIADPVVLQNAALQAHTHCGVDADAIFYSAQAAAAAQMTAYQFQILATHLLGGKVGKILQGCAVETVAPNGVLSA